MAEAGYAWASDSLNASFTATVQTGSEDSGYLASALIDPTFEVLHKPAKLTTTSGAWLLTAAAGSPQVELAVLWLHNFDEGLTVRLEGHGADNWADPDFSQAFTIPAAWADGRRVPVFLDLRMTAAATTGFAYYRLVVAEANASPIAAKLLLYSTLSTIRGYLLAGTTFAHDIKATVLLTDLGFMADALEHQIRSRSFQGDVVPESLSEMQAIEAWYIDSQGGSPVVWIPNLTVNDAWFVRFVKPPTFVPLSHAAWRISLDLLELAPGAPL